MLINLFLLSFYYPTVGILSLLPSGHLPVQVGTAFTAISGYWKYGLQWFPIDTLLIVLGLILATEVITIGIWVVFQVIRWIRG